MALALSVKNVPTGMLPPGVGSMNAQGLYQFALVFTLAGHVLPCISMFAAGGVPPPLNGLPTRMALIMPKPLAGTKIPPPLLTVNGMPVCAVHVALADHPPMR